MNNGEQGIEALKKEIAALKTENKELCEIIKEAPIPIFVVNKDHKITHFNKACEELTGYKAKEMIGTDNQWKAFYSKKRPVMADLIVDSSSDAQIVQHYGLKYKRSFAGENRFAASDFFPDLGEKGKWLFFTAAPVLNTKGEITGAVESLQDVTEEKIASSTNRDLYRQYRMILEFVPYPIVVYDVAGNVSYINPAFANTFGWSLEELKGKTVPFVPENLEQETSQMLDKFRKDKSLTRYETQRYTKDKRILDVVIWAASYAKHQKKSYENFVILRDITEEKRLAANNKTIMRISTALPEYHELEDLMNYITKEIKYLLNTEGALVLLYDEIKEDFFFLGASYDNTDTEKRIKEIRFPVDQVLAGEAIKTGEPALINDTDASSRQFPERDKKLGYKTRNILVVPIKIEGRSIGALCAINKKLNLFDDSDIELMSIIAGTAAISIENAWFSDEVKKAYRDVASMNRAKGKAINHLSHELKTPVAILTGSLNILKKKLEAIPEKKWKKTFDRVERNLNRIVEIQDEVADIMEDKTYSSKKMMLKMLEACQDELETLIEQQMSEPEQIFSSVSRLIDEKFGPRNLEHDMIDLSAFFNLLYNKQKSNFGFRNIDILVDIENNLPKIFMPSDILKKVIVGIIKNAVENTPDNGRIEILINKNEKGITFKVHDYGVGIEPEAQKRIFDGFFSTQETLLYSTKTPYAFNAGGKGADLLRMKILSERLGFSITMESERCIYLFENKDEVCPGNTDDCKFITSSSECIQSGYSIFTVFFPIAK